MLPSAGGPFRPWPRCWSSALFLVCDSLSMHVEFRRQTYSWSLSELALTISLVELGGAWTALVWIVGLAVVMAVQSYPPREVRVQPRDACCCTHRWPSPSSMPCPPAPLTAPLRWFELILAVLVADLAGALMVSVAIISTAGYQGPQMWRDQLVPIAVVSPVVVSVAIIALLLSSLSPWSWLLTLPVLTVVGLLFRRFGTVAREGKSLERVYDFARRVEQVTPDEAGTMQIVEAVRELLNAERVALWLPPYLDEEPRLVVSAENGVAWYDGPGGSRRPVPAAGAQRDRRAAAGLGLPGR